MSKGSGERTDGNVTRLEHEAVEELRGQVGDQLIEPRNADYEAVRRVWNGMIDRRPALVLRCRGAADVAAGVRFAGTHGLPLAVRGGGHNVAGFGTCDGGLVLDLSPLCGVRVDRRRSVARVGGGATWADVDRETQPFGHAVPGGIVSTTGVGGLTLGGGQGWLRRTFGMTCDNLLSADVVTADGELRLADENEHADLFWALRGGGGNFGVVTSFELRAHPVGPTVAFAGPVYPLESAATILAEVDRLTAGAPDELNLSVTFWTLPAAPVFPAELHGRAVVVVGALWAGAAEEGEERLRPLRELEKPLVDLSGTLPYTALQQFFDPFFPAHDLHYYWKSIYLDRLDSAAVETIAVAAASRPSPLSMVGLWKLGGALDRVDAAATAAGARGAPYLLEILANWNPTEDADVNIRWARELFAAAAPFATGKTNLNFPGTGDEPGFARAAFGDNWDRLVEVKRRYDPTNLFRLNQNIDPGAPAPLLR